MMGTPAPVSGVASEIDDYDAKVAALIADDDDLVTYVSRLEDMVNNQRDLNQLTRFLVQEAFTNLPELHQIELAIKSQERLLKSNKRSYYAPELGASFSWEKPIGYWGELDIPGFTGLPKNSQFVAAGKISLPIFQGGLRKAEVQKSKVSIAQLQDQQANLKNGLEEKEVINKLNETPIPPPSCLFIPIQLFTNPSY